MKDLNKTKKQLIEEIENLRKTVSALEASADKRQRMEEAMWESEDRLRMIMESAEDIITLIDLEGKYLFYNGSPHYGLKPQDVVGKTAYEFFDHQTARAMIERARRVAASGQPITEENSVLWNGEKVWFLDHVCPVRNVKGSVAAVAVISRNITERKKAEEVLERSERRFRSLIRNSTDLITVIDAQGVVRYEGTSSAQVIGYSPEDRIGVMGLDNIHPDDLLRAREAFAELIQNPEKVNTFEFRYRHKDGSWRWLESTARNLLNDPDVGGIVVNTRDISDRKKTEEAVRQNERRFGALIRNSTDLITIMDEKGISIYQSASMDRVSGYRPEERIGTSGFEYIHPDDLPRALRAFSEITNDPQKIVTVELRYRHRDGTWRVMESTARNLLNDPDIRGIVINSHDITDRKMAEEALKESEEKFRTLAEKSPAMIFINRKGRIVYINEKCEEMLEYTREEVLSPEFDFYVLIAPEYHGTVRAGYARQSSGEEVPPYEYALISKTGRRIEAIRETRLIRFSGETAILGIITDITERKKAEEKIVRLNRLYSVMSRANEAIVRIRNRQDLFTEICRIAVEEGNLGMAWIGLIDGLGKCVTPVAHWGSGKEIVEKIRIPLDDSPEGRGPTGRAARRGKLAVINDFRSDPRIDPWRALALPFGYKSMAAFPLTVGSEVVGTLSLYSITPVFFKDEEIKLLLALAGDISFALESMEREERRRAAEEALRRSEDRYRRLVETSPDAITVTDMNLKIIMLNQQAVRLFGYASPEEVIGTSGMDFIHPDDRARAVENNQQTLMTGTVKSAEYTLVRRDGTTFPSELSSSVITGPHGIRQGFIVVVRDISERKKLEDQFLQAQKMESVGRLAGGVAHDFNNILTVITSYAAMARKTLAAGEPIRGYLDEILKSSERATNLISQLLAFSRRQVIKPKVVDLNDLILNMDRMLRRLIGEDILLVTTPSPVLWKVRVDRSQIEQLIINLAVNGRDAMPNGGTLTIETSNVTILPDTIPMEMEAPPGDYAVLTVTDSGEGMTEDVKKHLFEPFFTTKGVGKGTGLGLATVYGVVKQNNGSIRVKSAPSKGTSFTIFFPRMGEKEEKESIGNETVDLARRTETVLVVEDDPAVLDILGGTLRKLGHTVLTASGGVDALRMAHQHAGEIHLLVTDVIMPQMNGKELADRIVTLYPRIKVLYVSGYMDDAIGHQGTVEEGLNLVQKPFTPEVLAKRVQETLDGD